VAPKFVCQATTNWPRRLLRRGGTYLCKIHSISLLSGYRIVKSMHAIVAERLIRRHSHFFRFANANDVLGSTVECSGPADGCHALVRMALERGGPDNITVQILRVSVPG